MATSAAQVSLDPPALVPAAPQPLRGFGAQFNTNLFTREGESKPLAPAELAALGETIQGLRLGHSRIFIRPAARSARSPQRKALLSTIELAQQAGANVNLTWWKGPFPHAPQSGHAAKRRQLMDDFAEIVAEARASGFSCVTHLTVMNEVNAYDIAKALKPRKSMELYNSLYRDLDEALRARRDPKRPARTLRASIALVGGDLVEKGPGSMTLDGEKHSYAPSSQNVWLRFMEKSMSDVLDAYSIHVYWEPGAAQFPASPTKRLEDLRKLGIEKPIYVTEYGVRQLTSEPRPGLLDGMQLEQSLQTAFQHAWFNALAPQYGCVGLTKWVLYRTTRQAEFGNWGMIGPRRDPNGAFRRWPTCDVTMLFNSLIGPQWTAAGLGSTSEPTLLASAFQGPRGKHSVVVLNNGQEATPVRVEGLKPRVNYRVIDWNADGAGSLEVRHRIATPATGAAGFTVPALGLTALTTQAVPV